MSAAAVVDSDLENFRAEARKWLGREFSAVAEGRQRALLSSKASGRRIRTS